MTLNARFWDGWPIIGMAHLRPLPGSPQYRGERIDSIIDAAMVDAQALEAGGAAAVMVENFYDAPFALCQAPRHTIAAMTLCASAVRQAVSIPVGVNVLRNDARAAIAIAHLCGAGFVRINVFVGAAVTDQGIIQGAAREAVLYRKELSAEIQLWADVFVKHAVQLGPGAIETAAKDALERGLADALIVSGDATGAATSIEDLQRVRSAAPQARVLIGSGFDAESAASLVPLATGAIVGTSLQVDGRIEADRVRALRMAVDAVAR